MHKMLLRKTDSVIRKFKLFLIFCGALYEDFASILRELKKINVRIFNLKQFLMEERTLW